MFSGLNQLSLIIMIQRCGFQPFLVNVRIVHQETPFLLEQRKFTKLFISFPLSKKEILSVILFAHFSSIFIPFQIVFDGIPFHKLPITFTRLS